LKLGAGRAAHRLLRLPSRPVPLGHARRGLRYRRPDPARRAAPVYDSPTTRGLYDPKTKVYWAVDTFATPLPDLHMGVADLDQEFWRELMWVFALGAVSPWLTMLDHDKFGRYVDQVQGLDITTIA